MKLPKLETDPLKMLKDEYEDEEEDEEELTQQQGESSQAPNLNSQEFIVLELPTGIKLSLGSCKYDIYNLCDLAFDVLKKFKNKHGKILGYVG